MNHLLTGNELTTQDIKNLIVTAMQLKKERANNHLRKDLIGKQLALLFDKPSLRTRFSFTVAMRDLGGDVIESVETTRKSETPEDQARVLSGYCHVIAMRTHSDEILNRMSVASTIPVINSLSDLHHPCQILSDLMTLHEKFGNLEGLTLTYIGDGNNILHSLLLLAPQMGIRIRYCCPKTRQPDANILATSKQKLVHEKGGIQAYNAPEEAVKNSNAVYTDVWTSMGFESQIDEKLFDGYQVNSALMSHAAPNAIFMHCLPMARGKEVDNTLPDQPCSVIFQQSENRLHMQKALLLWAS